MSEYTKNGGPWLGARRPTAEINAKEAERRALEAEYGQVWSTDELTCDFDVEGFCAPCVVVRRKTDNVRGSLFFQHSPRFYWGFEEC
jgi:hypothetical protein